MLNISGFSLSPLALALQGPRPFEVHCF